MIIFWIYCVKQNILLKLLLPVSSFKVWLLENLEVYVAWILFLLGSAGLSPLRPGRVGGVGRPGRHQIWETDGAKDLKTGHLPSRGNILCWFAVKTVGVRFSLEYQFPFRIWTSIIRSTFGIGLDLFQTLFWERTELTRSAEWALCYCDSSCQ